MSQDHNLEPEGRWEFKKVKAFVQGHKVRVALDCISNIKATKDKKNKTNHKNTLDKTAHVILALKLEV